MGILPTIGTLWVGDRLSWLEQLCLKSFLDHGHKVVLFKYDAVANVPDGVQTHDANEILPADKIIRHAKTGSPAYHADVFRLHMLAQTDYIWADTDAFCTQPWHLEPDTHLHGWISDADLVNNGVLGLPKNSKTLARMFEFTSDEYPIPPWFKPAKQAKLRALKDKGEGVHVSLLPWGVWGPNALTWFLRETGEIEHSSPGHMLFPLPFPQAGFPLNPRRINKVEKLIRKDTLSIHLWGRRFRNIAAKYNGRPEQGCYISKMLKKHNIDPVKTAYLMPAPGDKDVAINPPTGLDFSMFKLTDIAKNNQDSILQNALTLMCHECGVFLKETDKINPGRIADIGCGYGFASLLLYRRYTCDIVLIDGDKVSSAGQANLTQAKAFLVKNGVPLHKIQVLSPSKQNVSKIKPVDFAISLASCGMHYPVETYASFFDTQITAQGGFVLDIRKGSGGIKTMKSFGDVTVLRKQPKHSMVFAKNISGTPQ